MTDLEYTSLCTLAERCVREPQAWMRHVDDAVGLLPPSEAGRTYGELLDTWYLLFRRFSPVNTRAVDSMTEVLEHERGQAYAVSRFLRLALVEATSPHRVDRQNDFMPHLAAGSNEDETQVPVAVVDEDDLPTDRYIVIDTEQKHGKD